MATKKETVAKEISVDKKENLEAIAEEEQRLKELPMHLKLAAIRVSLIGIQKGGKNDFGKYNYYELSDFLPIINEKYLLYGLNDVVTTEAITNMAGEVISQKMVLTVIDALSGQAVTTEIVIPYSDKKGNQAIQEVGAFQTYGRRYLYLALFGITDGDKIDNQNSLNDNQPQAPANKGQQQTMTESNQTSAKQATIQDLVNKVKQRNDKQRTVAALQELAKVGVYNAQTKNFNYPAIDTVEQSRYTNLVNVLSATVSD